MRRRMGLDDQATEAGKSKTVHLGRRKKEDPRIKTALVGFYTRVTGSNFLVPAHVA